MDRAGSVISTLVVALVVSWSSVGCGGSDRAENSQPSVGREARATAGSADADERPLKTQTNALGRRELPAIRRMLHRLIEGINDRNPAICTTLYTRRYRESLMERKGAAALGACRKAVAGLEFQSSLVRIERVEVNRSETGRLSGQVRVLQRVGTDQLLRSEFGVVRVGGEYRITSGRGKEVTSKPAVPPSSPPG